MKTLEPPDTFHVSAAVGWLELGNKAEARQELARLRPESMEHPDVLELRWTLAADARDWPECVALAETLVRLAPDREFGWIHRSYALHELKRTREAWDLLLPAAEKFPDEFLIPYNLACYATQMGNMDEARTWLSRAVRYAGVRRVRSMAAHDEDLRPLWPEIDRLLAPYDTA